MDDPLERDLVELGRHLDVPPAPDVVDAVRQRIAAGADARESAARARRQEREPYHWWHRSRLLQAAAAVLLVFAALIALSPQVRAAVGDFLRFAGIDIHRESSPIKPSPGALPTLPGERVATLAEAREHADFDIRVPAALGPPDEVRLADGDPPRVVTLIYRAAAGRPVPDPSGVAIRIDEFAGSLSPVYEKYGAQADPVQLDGYLAIWVPAPHTILYLDRSGLIRSEAARLSAQTLIWQVGVTAIRMEGDFTKDEAIAIARSTLP
jgi:hypothetical protein